VSLNLAHPVGPLLWGNFPCSECVVGFYASSWLTAPGSAIVTSVLDSVLQTHPACQIWLNPVSTHI